MKSRGKAGIRAKRGIKTFASRVKKVIMRTTELKRCPTSVSKLEVFHNVMLGQTYLLNQAGTMPTVGGSQQSNRIGDQINVEGWKIRCLFGQKADRPNVNWKFMVFSVPKGNTVAYNAVFKDVTGNVMLDEPNTDTTKVLFSRSFRPNQSGLAGIGGDEFTFFKKFYIPHKRVYKFGPAENVVTHNQPDIYVVVLCYDAYGSVLTDNIGYMQMFHEMQFRDPQVAKPRGEAAQPS